jgi:hypothetical protein
MSCLSIVWNGGVYRRSVADRMWRHKSDKRARVNAEINFRNGGSVDGEKGTPSSPSGSPARRGGRPIPRKGWDPFFPPRLGLPLQHSQRPLKGDGAPFSPSARQPLPSNSFRSAWEAARAQWPVCGQAISPRPFGISFGICSRQRRTQRRLVAWPSQNNATERSAAFVASMDGELIVNTYAARPS